MARGNRLAVERGVAGTSVSYSHHGIDVGDGTVVHARPHDFRAPFGGGRVERTSLAEFAAGREVRVVGRGAGRVVVRTLAGTTLWLAGSAAAGAAGRLTRD
ncbi:MAG: lecithin retinol acyltransferase family protein [Planctomycetaceae bacterium]